MFPSQPTLRWRLRLWATATAALLTILIEPRAARADPEVPLPPNGLLSDRNVGAVSDADRDFVVKVRLAGLWEIPAGDMAQRKSDDSRIRAIGREIARQHRFLDKFDRDAASKLGVELPDEPNDDQRGWLAEMAAADGSNFDTLYIARLRAAHGKIFPAIATIRSSTRNDTVRKLAQQANQFVMTHMTLLESSGIVDYAALPTAPPPTTPAKPAPDNRLLAAVTGDSTSTLTAVLILTLVLGGMATALIMIRGRPRYRRRNVRHRRL
ncbi:DUF4142 domain-containing protein [Actinoplanes sp. NPDC051475]|uniref:DUF4142 domain-containing protein n=1 Tax=Actinoplanes sp. NPDC051475 TaxID=3157225 RepID=UPI003450141C